MFIKSLYGFFYWNCVTNRKIPWVWLLILSIFYQSLISKELFS